MLKNFAKLQIIYLSPDIDLWKDPNSLVGGQYWPKLHSRGSNLRSSKNFSWVQLKSFHRSLWSSIVISRVEQSHFIGIMGQAWSFHVSRKKNSQVGIFANLETNFHLLLRTEWCRNWAKLNSISLLQSNSIYNLKTAKSPKKICYSYEKADIAVFYITLLDWLKLGISVITTFFA